MQFVSLNSLLSILGSTSSLCLCLLVTLSGSRLRSVSLQWVRASGRSGHTLTWPLSRDPDAWSRRPATPAPEGSGGSPGASHSLYLTPTWLLPSASCNTGRQAFYSRVQSSLWYLIITLSFNQGMNDLINALRWNCLKCCLNVCLSKGKWVVIFLRVAVAENSSDVHFSHSSMDQRNIGHLSAETHQRHHSTWSRGLTGKSKYKMTILKLISIMLHRGTLGSKCMQVLPAKCNRSIKLEVRSNCECYILSTRILLLMY